MYRKQKETSKSIHASKLDALNLMKVKIIILISPRRKAWCLTPKIQRKKNPFLKENQ